MRRDNLLIFAEEADVPAYAAVAGRFGQLASHIEATPEGFCQAMPEADIICMARKYDKRWLLNAPRLRWLHVGGTGIDRLYPLTDLPVDLVISNTPGLNAEMMADYTICTLLMLTWNFPRLWRNQMAAVWERWGVERVEGKTLTLVGVGNIGSAIARRAGVLGLRVRGIKRTPSPMPEVEDVVGPDQMLAALHASDYVVVAVPLTAETRGLIGRRELDAMPSTSYLINISRGAVVQEQALVAALEERVIAGAALDVFETEPLPRESALWALDNVILTPHVSSWSRDYRLRAAEIFGINLERYMAGQPPLHVVDRSKGY